MALNFPSAPSTNTTYTFNNKTWTYNGNAWALSYGSLSTSVVPEGANQYFSNARVYANVSQLGFITSNSLSGYATNAQLTSYATTSNVALKANIADIIVVSNTVPISVTTAAGTATVSLLTSGVSATTYGGSTSIPIITVDTYGRITSASNVSVTSGTTITDDTSTNATRYLTLTASSSGSISTANVSTTKLFFNPSTGLLTSTDYNSSSDRRLKTNIKTVENAVEKVSALRGVTFDWREGESKGIGLIAQEVESIIPEVVTTDEYGYMGIKYTNIIGILVEAIKEQQEQINTLKKQIEKL